jgi:transposase, IS5 family
VYTKELKDQPEFENFYLPFNGKLDKSNRWVTLSKLVPWDRIEEKYSMIFSERRGAPALPLRTALGALIIKERCGFTDEETVAQIIENPYLQYFLGFREYRSEPSFDSSMMVHFRKRINLDMMTEINEIIITETKSNDAKEEENRDKPEQAEPTEKPSDEPKNDGVLIVDATCAPADIRYPTDISLLNEAREKLEMMIDKVYEQTNKATRKPRTYREIARKKFIAFIGQKKPKYKVVRKALKNQLEFVSRDVKHLTKLVEDNPKILHCLKKKEYKDLLVIKELYRQQQEMFDEKKHRIDSRIVSISQPHIRPIVRGKASTNVEFGAKLTVSLKDGFSRIEKHSWENFNESTLLKDHVNAYFEIHGAYPKVVAADKIYHNRDNKNFCKEHGIKITLGMMPSEFVDNENPSKSIRNAIEGKFGEAKRRYSLARIMAKLDTTAKSVVGVIILIMNLEKKLRLLLSNFLFQYFSFLKMDEKQKLAEI